MELIRGTAIHLVMFVRVGLSVTRDLVFVVKHCLFRATRAQLAVAVFCCMKHTACDQTYSEIHTALVFTTSLMIILLTTEGHVYSWVRARVRAGVCFVV